LVTKKEFKKVILYITVVFCTTFCKLFREFTI
jgi:hypothetical protein